MELLISIVYLLIAVAVLVGVIYVVVWVLGRLGIVIPPQIMNVVWVIVALLVLLWVLQALLGGGLTVPRLRY